MKITFEFNEQSEQTNPMSNYKEVAVNSKMDKFAKIVINDSLYHYIHSRVWEDDMLLGGFCGDEIKNIIEQTIEKYGDDINQFVAVALEKVADEFLKNMELTLKK